MIDIAILKAMVAAGASQQAVLAAIEADQKIELEHRAERKERNRIRVRNQRSRARTVEHVPAHTGTIEHTEHRENSPPKVPPITPLNLTPLPSNPSGSTADVVGEDAQTRLFRIGKTILVSFGISEQRTGKLLGQWLKAKNDPAGLLAALEFARDRSVAEPVAYISALLHGKSNGHAKFQKPDLAKIGAELADDFREQERARGLFGSPEPQ